MGRKLRFGRPPDQTTTNCFRDDAISKGLRGKRAREERNQPPAWHEIAPDVFECVFERTNMLKGVAANDEVKAAKKIWPWNSDVSGDDFVVLAVRQFVRRDV